MQFSIHFTDAMENRVKSVHYIKYVLFITVITQPEQQPRRILTQLPASLKIENKRDLTSSG